ncbi:MAG: M23 family metallopeptidase [Chloroflexi bacterium]|nr:M23 family metallopeptidase [Chloroflexota bacterium]
MIVRYGFSYVIFAHLSAVSANVGDRVPPGRVLGNVGSYSDTDGFGSHLHLEVRNFSQAQDYGEVIAAGLEGGTGVITPLATSDANPLPFI